MNTRRGRATEADQTRDRNKYYDHGDPAENWWGDQGCRISSSCYHGVLRGPETGTGIARAASLRSLGASEALRDPFFGRASDGWPSLRGAASVPPPPPVLVPLRSTSGGLI